MAFFIRLGLILSPDLADSLLLTDYETQKVFTISSSRQRLMDL
jgi:hypothetical protein